MSTVSKVQFDNEGRSSSPHCSSHRLGNRKTTSSFSFHSFIHSNSASPFISVGTAIVKTKNDLVLSSNENIQHSFIGIKFGLVGSCVDIFSVENGSQGHAYSSSHQFYSRSKIYTLPYQFRYYSFLFNSFENGTFEMVQTLSMSDMGSFEHELFQIVSRSFPFLRSLHIFNNEAQITARIKIIDNISSPSPS